MQGWIKLHRKILDNPIVCKDSDHLAVWVYLLLNATHENYPAMFKGVRITLEPGQLITGRKSISEKLSISESKTKRILIALENDQQIDRQRSSQNSLITILNWDKYQECDQQKGQQMDSQRPASDQPVTTNKNVKNVKNVKKDIYIDLAPELHEPLKEYIDMRKRIKKTMTDRAVELLISKLEKLAPYDTQTQIAMLEEATMRNWLSVYPSKEETKQKSSDYLSELIREGMQNESNRYGEDYEVNPVAVQKLLPGSR